VGVGVGIGFNYNQTGLRRQRVSPLYVERRLGGPAAVRRRIGGRQRRAPVLVDLANIRRGQPKLLAESVEVGEQARIVVGHDDGDRLPRAIRGNAAAGILNLIEAVSVPNLRRRESLWTGTERRQQSVARQEDGQEFAS